MYAILSTFVDQFSYILVCMEVSKLFLQNIEYIQDLKNEILKTKYCYEKMVKEDGVINKVYVN